MFALGAQDGLMLANILPARLNAASVAGFLGGGEVTLRELADKGVPAEVLAEGAALWAKASAFADRKLSPSTL